jgi:hypothetical protein
MASAHHIKSAKSQSARCEFDEIASRRNNEAPFFQQKKESIKIRVCERRNCNKTVILKWSIRNWPKAGNTYLRGRISTDDLLVQTSSDHWEGTGAISLSLAFSCTLHTYNVVKRSLGLYFLIYNLVYSNRLTQELSIIFNKVPLKL